MAFYMVYLLYPLQEVIFYDGKAKRTNPEYGYIHQARKKGLGYLTEMTVGTRHGIITGVTVIQLTRGKVILSWNI